MSIELLTRECRVYSRYLIGCDPTDYVLQHYLRYHSRAATEPTAEAFDHTLVRMSRRGPFFARLADTYASRFARHSLLRKKLVLMLALLECSPRVHSRLHRSRRGSLLLVSLALAWKAAAYAATLGLALLLFAPMRLAACAASPAKHDLREA